MTRALNRRRIGRRRERGRSGGGGRFGGRFRRTSAGVSAAAGASAGAASATAFSRRRRLRGRLSHLRCFGRRLGDGRRRGGGAGAAAGAPENGAITPFEEGDELLPHLGRLVVSAGVERRAQRRGDGALRVEAMMSSIVCMAAPLVGLVFDVRAANPISARRQNRRRATTSTPQDVFFPRWGDCAIAAKPVALADSLSNRIAAAT